jgi:hypothetical protein
MYPLLALLSLLSLYALCRAMQKKQVHWWVGFTVATVLNLYTHYFALLATAGTLLFAGSALAYQWLGCRNREARGTLSRLFLCCVIVALLYAPWLPAMRVNFFQRQADFAAQQKASGVGLDSALLAQTLQEFAGGQGTVSVVVTSAAVLGLVALVLRARWKALALHASWILPPLVAVILIGPRKFSPRYVAYLQPLLLLLAAVGMVGLPADIARAVRPIARRRSVYVAMSILGALGMGVVSLAAIGRQDMLENHDWKGAVAYLEQVAGKGDIVIVDGPNRGGGADSGRPHRMLSWYLRQDKGELILWREVDVAPGIGRVAYQNRQVFAVVTFVGSATWQQDPESMVSVSHFGAVGVLCLNKPKDTAVGNAIDMLEAMGRCLKRSQAKFDIYLALAELYKSEGHAEKAESCIAKALAIMPEALDPRTWRSKAYYRLGLDHYQQDADRTEATEQR